MVEELLESQQIFYLSQRKDLSHKTIPERLSMTEACSKLRISGVRFTKLTELQIKVGSISFYPSTGISCVDGQRGYKRKGLDFFLELLRSKGLS